MRTGAYEFKLAPAAVAGVVPDDHLELIGKGEWAWVDRTQDYGWLLLHRCPDCGCLGSLWQKDKGHTIDAEGNVSPSVLERCYHECGFHTQPTKLLSFVDARTRGSGMR